MRFSNLVLSSTFSVRTLRFVTILPALCRLVGTDDVLHQLVAHHIPVGEFADGDVVHLPQDTGGDDQTAFLLVRQVDLGGVSGNDHPAALAQTGEEHLHLFTGGVLRLVQDDKGGERLR